MTKHLRKQRPCMQTIVLIILYYCTSIMNWRRLIMINCIIRGYFRNIVAMFKITKFFWKTSSSKETVKMLAKLYQLIAARNIVINVNRSHRKYLNYLIEQCTAAKTLQGHFLLCYKGIHHMHPYLQACGRKILIPQ